jgi:hypothetical protein
MARLQHLLLALGVSALLSACQFAGGAFGGGRTAGPDDVTPNAVIGDAIEVTALDSPPPAAAAAPTAGPATASVQAAAPPAAPPPAPAEAVPAAAAPQPEAVADALAAPKSEQQIACERRKGRWSPTGKGDLRVCVFTTRDGGKQCTRESQCDGVCLARSGTCAPVKPLLGCNEILQDNGARVTLCIE